MIARPAGCGIVRRDRWNDNHFDARFDFYGLGGVDRLASAEADDTVASRRQRIFGGMLNRGRRTLAGKIHEEGRDLLAVKSPYERFFIKVPDESVGNNQGFVAERPDIFTKVGEQSVPLPVNQWKTHCFHEKNLA